MTNTIVNVQDQNFGAKGDGVTDDTAAIQSAINSLPNGGVVYLPPTGAAYLISDSITLGNGVILEGNSGKCFPGMNALNSAWTSAGSWIQPTHATNSAIKLMGHGSGIKNINFIHNQSVPTGSSWTPNIYGWCIEQFSSFSFIENIMIVNASHGIYMHYTPTSGGGTNVYWKDIIVSAFVNRIRTTCVNDTAYLSDIHLRNLWYASDSRVVSYLRQNSIGWRCGYTDNIMVNGIEFFEDGCALYLEDETCLGNTHSLYNATLCNAQFNLPQVCVKSANNTVTSTINFSNTISQTGNSFGLTWSDTAFQLSSPNISLKFNGLTVGEAGGTLFSVGGKLTINNLDVDRYSTSSSNLPCINSLAGASIRINNYRIRKLSSSGNRFNGSNNISITGSGVIPILGRFFEESITLNGTYQDLSVSSNFCPGSASVHQVRLIGEFLVNTPIAGALSVRLGGGVQNVITSGYNTGSTGWISYDTGWVDLLDSDIDNFLPLGRVQVNGPSGVNLSTGSMQVLYR